MKISLDPTEAFGLDAMRVARVAWAVVFIVTMVLLLGRYVHAVPYHDYSVAGRHWLAAKPLYNLHNIDGFQYFPQAALVFAPFAWLGWPLGDVIWRAIGWSLYAFGIWRFAGKLMPEQAEQGFFLATALAVGPAVGNLINGQANLMLAGLSLHVGADLIEKRYGRATAWLAFGFALKPLMGVLLLLVWALYRPMSWRIPLALAGVFLVPWLFRDHAYVMAQYTDCLTKLKICAKPHRQFEDVRGLLATLGWSMLQTSYLVLRALAAFATLAICWRARHHVAEPRGTFLIAAFALAYLMLFNPRTLSTSYVMPGAFGALLAARYVLQRRTREAWIMSAIMLAWTINYHVLSFVAHWLRPLACVAFLVLLVRETAEPRSVAAAQ